jgi:hypothetical protein
MHNTEQIGGMEDGTKRRDHGTAARNETNLARGSRTDRRELRAVKEQLKQQLRDGLESSEPREMTEQDWDFIRSEVAQRIRQ